MARLLQYVHPLRAHIAVEAHALVMELEAALNERSPSEVRLWRRHPNDPVPVNGHLITSSRDIATTTALFESVWPSMAAAHTPRRGLHDWGTESLATVVLYQPADMERIKAVRQGWKHDMTGRLTNLRAAGANFEPCGISDADAIDAVEAVMLPKGLVLHPEMRGQRILSNLDPQSPVIPKPEEAYA